MKISVAIPCYDMMGDGESVLSHSFSILEKQIFKNFEVVITDHSLPEETKIEELCSNWSKRLDIKYYRNPNGIGNPSINTNMGIEKSSGDIIKMLCQDDYLYDENSLQVIHDAFEEDTYWVATSYVHTNNKTEFFNRHTPRNNNYIHIENTIGTPSCVAFRSKDKLLLDENLVWAYDCEYYKRIQEKYGYAKIVDVVTMVNYLHPKQVTNFLADSKLRKKEIKYVTKKFED